jgi:predicted nucleotidyltransferase
MDQLIQRDLDIIKEKILHAVPAEAIYLFGSYAYGIPNADSDLDIYVVVPDTITHPPLDISAEIMTTLYKKIQLPIDLIVGKSSTFHNRKEAPTLQKTIAQQGVLLYEQ